MSYGNLGAVCSEVTSDPTCVPNDIAIARGELAEGQHCKIAGIAIRRGGGEHGSGLARGYYYAVKDGLSLHQDGTWAAGLRRPGMPKPAPGAKIAREDLTGLFDTLAELLSHLTF